MIIRLLALLLVCGSFQAFAAEQSWIEKIKGPMLILDTMHMRDASTRAHTYIVRIGDGETSVFVKTVAYNKKEAFDKQVADWTQYKGEPAVNTATHKSWKSEGALSVSLEHLYFVDPLNRGVGSPSSLVELSSINEFMEVTAIKPDPRNFDSPVLMLNTLLRAHSDVKLVSVIKNEDPSDHYTYANKSYYLSR